MAHQLGLELSGSRHVLTRQRKPQLRNLHEEPLIRSRSLASTILRLWHGGGSRWAATGLDKDKKYTYGTYITVHMYLRT